MVAPETEPDPRRWIEKLKAMPPTRAPAKPTMMARISGLFRVRRDAAPLAPKPEAPKPPRRPCVPGALAEATFEVPRCRSALVAGDSVENPPMEITVALRHVGTAFGLVFCWKETDAPDETRQRTEFTEEEDYVRGIYQMVVREAHAPRKIAEEIARARARGKSGEEGVLKALVDMETRPDWHLAYVKPAKG